jgi:hypothetical protein
MSSRLVTSKEGRESQIKGQNKSFGVDVKEQRGKQPSHMHKNSIEEQENMEQHEILRSPQPPCRHHLQHLTTISSILAFSGAYLTVNVLHRYHRYSLDRLDRLSYPIRDPCRPSLAQSDGPSLCVFVPFHAILVPFGYHGFSNIIVI